MAVIEVAMIRCNGHSESQILEWPHFPRKRKRRIIDTFGRDSG